MKGEIQKALEKIDIVKEWYFNRTGEEYICTNLSAQELIDKLEEVKQNGKK